MTVTQTAVPYSLSTVQAFADGPVGHLVLDRPDKLNALSTQVLEEVIAAADWFDRERAVKVVIVRGAGRAFSAGADITALGGADPSTDPAVRREAIDLGRRAAEALAGTRPLTIAAVHGHCVGGGLVLAAACDLRVAASGTVFAIPEVDLGIPLAWGGIPRLVREIGPAATKELVLTCRPFDADEARALRFLTRVVPAEDLLAEVDALATRLAGQPAYSLETTKRAANAVAEEIASTGNSFGDADLLLGALADPESAAKMRAYLSART